MSINELAFTYWPHGKQLQIIGRGWAKYNDLKLVSRSIICRSGRMPKIIDLRYIDKSWYFAITEFNNCFIIRSPSLFGYLDHSLTVQGSDLPFFTQEFGCNYLWAEYYLQEKKFRRAMQEQTSIWSGRVVVLCSQARKLTLTLPLSTQECKWVLVKCWNNLTECWGATCDGTVSHPGESSSSHYRNWSWATDLTSTMWNRFFPCSNFSRCFCFLSTIRKKGSCKKINK